ncbi:serine/threonine-protein phosphatase [Nonomuraea sp. PA05]|uniref:PP2C family protein-serine/threonine phosphatase n=1 Tax=Nonomuraea sp. PA05 TaxID=2604466 RepID=UPI0011D8289D|nr:protein phosphatase 2C domain-containing protein [Nonomuraea sp. PA05]TYB71275.1 serine/threonine-protein phosphatase [Nonomuraea sp. PA05]
MSPRTVEASARTHVGLVRRRNEDAVYAGQNLFAVADGLGGHAAGDVASSTVIDMLKPYDRSHPPAELSTLLGQAIHSANQTLRHRIEAEPKLATMGTTLVALLWSGTTVVVANIGDSRAYLLRDGELIQISEDHTYGNLVADAADVPHLPEKIARFLDGRADGRSPDLTSRELRPGDRFLLCSDGLSGVVPPEHIRSTLLDIADPAAAADRLIEQALDQGGPDNITVIVIDTHDG